MSVSVGDAQNQVKIASRVKQDRDESTANESTPAPDIMTPPGQKFRNWSAGFKAQALQKPNFSLGESYLEQVFGPGGGHNLQRPPSAGDNIGITTPPPERARRLPGEFQSFDNKERSEELDLRKLKEKIEFFNKVIRSNGESDTDLNKTSISAGATVEGSAAAENRETLLTTPARKERIDFINEVFATLGRIPPQRLDFGPSDNLPSTTVEIKIAVEDRNPATIGRNREAVSRGKTPRNGTPVRRSVSHSRASTPSSGPNSRQLPTQRYTENPGIVSQRKKGISSSPVPPRETSRNRTPGKQPINSRVPILSPGINERPILGSSNRPVSVLRGRGNSVTDQKETRSQTPTRQSVNRQRGTPTRSSSISKQPSRGNGSSNIPPFSRQPVSVANPSQNFDTKGNGNRKVVLDASTNLTRPGFVSSRNNIPPTRTTPNASMHTPQKARVTTENQAYNFLSGQKPPVPDIKTRVEMMGNHNNTGVRPSHISSEEVVGAAGVASSPARVGANHLTPQKRVSEQSILSLSSPSSPLLIKYKTKPDIKNLLVKINFLEAEVTKKDKELQVLQEALKKAQEEGDEYLKSLRILTEKNEKGETELLERYSALEGERLLNTRLTVRNAELELKMKKMELAQAQQEAGQHNIEHVSSPSKPFKAK